MLGYYKVPLYTDAGKTNIWDYIYFPVVSKEAATQLSHSTKNYVGWEGNSITSYFGGLFPLVRISPYTLRFGSLGMVGGPDDRNAIYSGDPRYLMSTNGDSTHMQEDYRSKFADITHPYMASETTFPADDKFNFLKVCNYDGKLYIPNGKYIEVTHRTDNTGVVYYVDVKLYESNGNLVYGSSEATFKEDVTAYYSGMPNDTGFLFGLDKMKQVMNFIDSSDKRYIRGATRYYPTLLDDMSGVDYSTYYMMQTSTWCRWVDQNTSGIYRSTCPPYIRDGGYVTYNFGDFSGLQSFFYRFLGFQNNKTTEENFANIEGEYEEVNTDPDADNTYPGGGNDQNQYPEDGTSGKGTFDNRNDPIDFPDMPLWDATSTGFISMWNPTITEISALYGFLWDSDISTTLKKMFLEPMEAIISLAFFPVDPTNFPDKRNVTIGHVDTGIQMYAVQKQFVDFDFGKIVVDEYYGAAWDYSPYTHASIYLPYIGVQAIDVDDVMRGELHLKYRIDLLSGMCSAMLKVDRSRDGLGAIIYTWQGNCAMFVPVTAGSAREFINSIIQIGAMAGVAMAQPAAGAIEARANRDVENYKAPSLGGNWINPAMSAYSTLNVLGQKVHVQRGGRVDSNAGVMSPQQAYIILSRPVSAIPKGWNKYAGYPSLKIKKLSTQKGYTEIAYIKLNNLEATAEEISELNSILRGGVIL